MTGPRSTVESVPREWLLLDRIGERLQWHVFGRAAWQAFTRVAGFDLPRIKLDSEHLALWASEAALQLTGGPLPPEYATPTHITEDALGNETYETTDVSVVYEADQAMEGGRLEGGDFVQPAPHVLLALYVYEADSRGTTPDDPTHIYYTVVWWDDRGRRWRLWNEAWNSDNPEHDPEEVLAIRYADSHTPSLTDALNALSARPLA